MPTKLIYFIFSFISGVLLAAAYLPFGLWWLSFIAIVPFMYIVWFSEIKSYKLIFGLSFLFFLVFFLIYLFWIRYVSFLGMLALCLFMAWLSAICMTIGKYVYEKLKISWWLIAIISWLSLEFVISYLFGGFPWVLLGYALAPVLSLCQIADIFGVFGISLLVIYINCAIAYVIKNYYEIESYAFIPLGYGIIFLAISWVYGNHIIKDSDSEEVSKIRIAIVQPNIKPEIKHDKSQDRKTINKIIQLSKHAAKSSPQLLIWPESAIAGYLQDYNVAYYYISNFFAEYKIPIMSGTTRYYDDYTTKKRLYYNSVSVLEPPMQIKNIRDKEHLVVFGEFIPFEEYLPFLKLVTPIDGSFSRGETNSVYEFKYGTNDENSVCFGPLICFEDVFPKLAIALVKKGANILVNLTNDGWFGNHQPLQHSKLAMFRAIETRTPLIRATNTGISSVFDKTGKVIGELIIDGKNVNLQGVLSVEIPIQPASSTFYMKCGNILAVASFICLFVLIVPAYRKA